jgi:hypothetical protein
MTIVMTAMVAEVVMSRMIKASEFKAKCLAIMDEWSAPAKLW